jgi:hypothetical protein
MGKVEVYVPASFYDKAIELINSLNMDSIEA